MPRLLGKLGHTVCALAIAASALSGCGGDDQDAAALASLAPPDAPLFAEVVIRPDGDQAEAIESFAERAGGVSDPGESVTMLIDLFLAENGIDATYADGVEPWLGRHGAVFVSSFEPTNATGSFPDLALIAEVEDAEAAREFLQLLAEHGPDAGEERSYEGADYYVSEAGFVAGLIDDSAVVFGTENAFQVAVDSSEGESLAESPEYTDRVDALPDDALASIFVEPAAAIEAVIASEGLDPEQARMWAPLLDGLLSAPIATTLTATPETASVDLAAMLDANVLLGADPSLLSGLPGDSWFAIAVPELGQALEHSLDQLSSSGLPGAGELERQVREATGIELVDVFSWLGDAAAFVAGTEETDFSAGLIAETSDPDASRDLLTALQRIPGVEAEVTGDRLVAARGTTVDDVLEPEATLGEAPGFESATEALGDDFPPGFYLDLPSFFKVAEQGSDGDVDYDAARPYTDAFASLIAGSRVEGDLVLSRFTVSLAGE